jgi:hypothetical protein
MNDLMKFSVLVGLTACAPKAPTQTTLDQAPPAWGNVGQVLSQAEVAALRCDFDRVMRSIDRPLPKEGVDSTPSSVVVCGYAEVLEPRCYAMPSPYPPHKAELFCEEEQGAYLIVQASDNPYFYDRFSDSDSTVNLQATDGTMAFRLGYYDEDQPSFVGASWSVDTDNMDSLILSTFGDPVMVELSFDADHMLVGDLLDSRKSFASGVVIKPLPSTLDPASELVMPVTDQLNN